MKRSLRRNSATPDGRSRSAFKDLKLPRNLTLDSLISFMEKRRGRPIVIAPMEGLSVAETCGLWFSTDSTEFIFHAPTGSELHRQQCISHELAHMILRHDETVVSLDYAATLFPDLDGQKVRSALGRSAFLDKEEIAAEMLADLLSGAIRNRTREPRNFERIFG